ncbi:DUF2868 domain-containing protein [Marinomonas spartinae]|uniref:DUF2868 domain-containing protein n=1 Tax=Marinomonas spartinae TaxID=1792290 RepID=UPI0018F16A3F|nr:DUF2868 domain-containing protein [Marinomonas spartinae]MBJ7554613.1 DUF2868 domain-containing protein [Marinomonas spartinae]
MALSTRGKLSIAAWLESHTDFRLPSRAANLEGALSKLDDPQTKSARPFGKNAQAETKPTKSYLAQCEQLQRYFKLGLYFLFAVTFLLGLLAVPPAFAVSSSGKVNIFWLLIVMLGFHGLNLIIWLIGMLALGNNTRQSKGVLLTSLIFINNKISKHSNINTDASSAFWHWQCPAHSNKWLLSAISHTAWFSYLLAGFLMTLLLLLTNQVNFVWETTLLGDQQFLWITQQLSALPHWLGISVPNQLDILASRVDMVSQTASTRQHWATLLLASIMLYGVLPRLLLSILSVVMYRIKRLTLPKNTQEQAIERRYKEQSEARVVDKERVVPSPASVNKATHSENPVIQPLDAHALGQIWGLFEWSQAIPESLYGAEEQMVLNDATQQQAFLQATYHKPLYLLVDGTHSPDRGSRRFLSQAVSAHPNVSLVIREHADEGDEGKSTSLFVDAWLRTGLEAGIHPDSIFRFAEEE